MLFSKAISRNSRVTIESDELKMINTKLKSYEVQCIINKVTMRMSEICEILHDNVDEITFIEIMSNAKIQKIKN